MRLTPFLLLNIASIVCVLGIGCSKSSAPQPTTTSSGTSAVASHVATVRNASAPAVIPVAVEQPTTKQSAKLGTRRVDACRLLATKEIQSVLGEQLKETKLSGKSENGLDVSQCFFVLPTFSKSIVLEVAQKEATPGSKHPREFWRGIFHPQQQEEREEHHQAEREREEGSMKPTPIKSVGDEAFWTGTRVGGALYVLEGDVYIRVSIGGADDHEVRIRKARALARLALAQLASSDWLGPRASRPQMSAKREPDLYSQNLRASGAFAGGTPAVPANHLTLASRLSH